MDNQSLFWFIRENQLYHTAISKIIPNFAFSIDKAQELLKFFKTNRN